MCRNVEIAVSATFSSSGSFSSWSSPGVHIETCFLVDFCSMQGKAATAPVTNDAQQRKIAQKALVAASVAELTSALLALGETP
jgi:hypothetical protein